jgi:hypothetical protein
MENGYRFRMISSTLGARDLETDKLELSLSDAATFIGRDVLKHTAVSMAAFADILSLMLIGS